MLQYWCFKDVYIVMRRFYISYKTGKMTYHYHMLMQYSVVGSDYPFAQNKVNSPVFVYNDSHLSLKYQYNLRQITAHCLNKYFYIVSPVHVW